MKNIKKIYIFLLAVIMFFISGCAFNNNGEDGQKNDGYYEFDYRSGHLSEDRFLKFYSSDQELDDFLNDFCKRHMRDTEDRIHTHPVGAGQSAWKEWESMIGNFWDACEKNGTMSPFYATNKWVTDWLKNAKQDKQGYIWSDEGDSSDSWGLGWEFPNYKKNAGMGYEFDISGNLQNWTVEGGSVSVSDSLLKVSSAAASEISLVSPPDFEVRALNAPFLKIGLELVNISGIIDDIYIYFKTEDETFFSEDKKLSFSEHCLTGFDIGRQDISGVKGYFFPMYINSKYGVSRTNKITGIKIVLKADTEAHFSGSAAFDYIYTDYDDRHSNNPCNFIIAAKNILEYAQDPALLAQILPKARQAMNFLYYQLGGSGGLISTEYFVGHDNDGSHSAGRGIGNGYWDVLAFPKVNLYSNISYYNALAAMTYLENMAEYFKVRPYGITTVNSLFNGKNTYSLDSDSLTELTDKCKKEIQTKFWNEPAGRFHAGIYDGGTLAQDHGYLMFNQQVIASGIATEAQAKLILSWINGGRTVGTDQSKGNDIYRYEFAPRFNTAEIGSDFYFAYTASFDNNVQNGGTALHLAYYDIVSQASLDINKGFKRLMKVKEWYKKVKAAGGSGQNFYHQYYDNFTDIGIQGGNSGGTIGVDVEFLEAALMFVSVKDAFLGISADYDTTLNIAPSFPDDLKFLRLENLVFGGYYYDAAVGKFFTQISGVGEYKKNSGNEYAKLRIVMEKPAWKFNVYLNGEETQNYSLNSGKITLNLPFADCKVEIKKAAKF